MPTTDAGLKLFRMIEYRALSLVYSILSGKPRVFARFFHLYIRWNLILTLLYYCHIQGGEHDFGEARQKKSSHRVYKTPWQGDPRVSIQNNKGKAKAYQVKQVLLASEKLEVSHGHKK